MKWGRRFWFSFIVLTVLIGMVFYFRKNYSLPAEEIQNSIQEVVAKPHSVPSPTAYPFYNLTIPYLRQQKYKSALGSLEKIDQNTSYTSYLTKYTSDGLLINGLLTVPVGNPPKYGWPAIVFVHGYIPPQQYTTLRLYVDYVDYLAKNGFVVFKIDLRGNGNSQGKPAGAYYSSGYVIDTLNAYAALQSVNTSSASAVLRVNPNKIGLWGHSMAGNILMRAWAVKPDIPAVVIWSGAGYTYADLMKYKIDDPSFQSTPSSSHSANLNLRQTLQKLYGNPDLSKPFWHDLAPVSYLSELKGAIQIDQAQDDPVVNIGYNRELMKLFDKTSVPHMMYEYPNGGHNISGPSFDQAMQNTVAFYKKYLE
jgi:dipeptidyl aminopeptidase/acylaminoacyl peptidase